MFHANCQLKRKKSIDASNFRPKNVAVLFLPAASDSAKIALASPVAYELQVVEHSNCFEQRTVVHILSPLPAPIEFKLYTYSAAEGITASLEDLKIPFFNVNENYIDFLTVAGNMSKEPADIALPCQYQHFYDGS